MRTINEEINEALAEELLENSVDGVTEEKPNYLTTNTVTMSLADFIGYYDAVNKLGTLLDELLTSSELDYNKTGLRVDGYNSKKIMGIVKELRPLEYVERYEALLEDKED